MPSSRLLAAAVIVLLPATAAADSGRFGATLGVDRGHGAGPTTHAGVFGRLQLGARLSGELALERIKPRDDTRGNPVVAVGAGLVYNFAVKQQAIPFARIGVAVEGGDFCTESTKRADLGLGLDAAVSPRVYLGTELRFSRRWDGEPTCYAEGDLQPPRVMARQYGDPWDDLAVRVSVGVGF